MRNLRLTTALKPSGVTLQRRTKHYGSQRKVLSLRRRKSSQHTQSNSSDISRDRHRLSFHVQRHESSLAIESSARSMKNGAARVRHVRPIIDGIEHVATPPLPNATIKLSDDQWRPAHELTPKHRLTQLAA